MKNENYICIDSKTFEIAKIENIFVVDQKLGKTISILNKKGYFTEICSKAKLSKPFMISDIVYNLKEENLININDKEAREKLKKVIDSVDYESTCIIFKEKYIFDELPKGFKMIDKDLYYNLKILKDSNDIEFKTLLELEKENNECFKNLEEWAEKLPIKNM